MKTVLGISLAAVGAFVFMGLQTRLIRLDRPPAAEEVAEAKAVAEKKESKPKAKFPDDLAPAAKAQPVAAAADFAVANRPHKIAYLKVNGALHPWHQDSGDNHEEWTANNVEEAELVVVLTKQTKSMIQRATFVNGPPIDRNRFELEASIIEAKTGKVLANRTFVNMPRPIQPQEQYEVTALGSPVLYRTVFNWVASQARGGFTPAVNAQPLITVLHNQ